MKRNTIFDGIIAGIEPEMKAEVSMNVRIANRISDILNEKKMSQRELALRMNKRESEISRWLTGIHGFTTTTLAKIEMVLGEPVIQVTKRQSLTATTKFVFVPYHEECRVESGCNVSLTLGEIQTCCLNSMLATK